MDIGLPSKSTLFQVQAERIRRLEKLAAEEVYGQGSLCKHPLRWYVMVSEFTKSYTEQHFKEHSFFGLDPNQVRFFEQRKLPCLSVDGKVLLQAKGKVAESPDGNGGIYRALKLSGCLEDMAERGIECLDCYCVDNLLARVADPFFLGYCWNADAELGCRAVAKRSPDEKVGVFVRKGNSVGVIEYSELDPKLSAAVGEGGELIYKWSNICMQYYSRNFLERLAIEEIDLDHHIANKMIDTVDGAVKGMKLEMFIFDVFSYATKACIVQVNREEEFAPVKNAFGSPIDSPDTAREALMLLHKRWMEKVGAQLGAKFGPQNVGVEIPPLVSYAGEGLEGYRGKIVEIGAVLPLVPKNLPKKQGKQVIPMLKASIALVILLLASRKGS